MVFNHYSIIISADWKNLRAWGGCSSAGKTATDDTNVPQTSLIHWDVSTKPESIIKIFSNGNKGGWGDGFTIFRTEEKNLYGTGNLSNGILGRTDVEKGYRVVARNVIDFCVGGGEFLLYVTDGGKVYGLGENLVAGYGFSAANRRALTVNNQTTDTNYLGINNAVKVFCTNPDGFSKSFALLNDGTVKACGYNTHGCLGVGSASNIVYNWDFVKTYDGGGNLINLTKVKDIVTTNFVAPYGANSETAETWAGGNPSSAMATYFLTEDGNVYTCGSNNWGQLGLGIATNQTRNVATKTSITGGSLMCTTAGGTSILVTTLSDEVYTWGNNQFGQLGHGDKVFKTTPTRANFPAKKIKMVHGGGMYGCINGAFLVVCEDGTLYGAGFNQTFALGVTNNGTPNPGPITTFTRNEYFGENPPQPDDPQRYPITISGGFTIVSGNQRVDYINDFQNKSVRTKSGNTIEKVYFREGMRVEGPGIPPLTYIAYIDRTKKYFILTNPATGSHTNATLTFVNIIKVYQADLCGYGTEMAQKVVAEDGTLYMSGWNQRLHVHPVHGRLWNFNYYYGSQNVDNPIFFDANFA
jgi:alpha-tubulin suppressor-like RCC1 family protein